MQLVSGPKSTSIPSGLTSHRKERRNLLSYRETNTSNTAIPSELDQQRLTAVPKKGQQQTPINAQPQPSPMGDRSTLKTKQISKMPSMPAEASQQFIIRPYAEVKVPPKERDFIIQQGKQRNRNQMKNNANSQQKSNGKLHLHARSDNAATLLGDVGES